jgi:hypothetical protein
VEKHTRISHARGPNYEKVRNEKESLNCGVIGSSGILGLVEEVFNKSIALKY